MANVPYSTSTASAAGPIPSGGDNGSSACNSNGDTEAQIPWGFDNNSTAFCGFSYPPSSKPLQSLQNCCEGPVLVSNGCFQYCKTGANDADFGRCVMDHVDIGDQEFSAQCNSREGSGGNDDDNDRNRNGGRRIRGGKSWVFGVVLWMAILRLGS